MAAKNIYVALWNKGAFEPAGIIAFDSETRISGFKYLNSYEGPPIDPIHLNYQETGNKVFIINPQINRHMLHRVFQDHLPGAWGMTVLMAENPELKKMSAAEQLYWFGTRTVGGLSCRASGDNQHEYPNRGMDKLIEIRKKSMDLFHKKIASITDKKAWWGLCSHGGARPKTSYMDEDGQQWLVKFNVDFDGYNGARVEHALAVMAKEAGIPSVDTKVVTLTDGNDVLFVKRFDRRPSKKSPVTTPDKTINIGGDDRFHQISLFSLLDESKFASQDQSDYMDLMRAVRTASANPQADAEQLFSQMLYNIGVNNTDDHAKNFSMLLTDEGYRLSPSYDVTPNTDPYPHAASICGLPRADLDEVSVLHFAKKLNISTDVALSIRSKVVTAIAQWEHIARQCGVGEADIALIEKRMYGESAKRAAQMTPK